MLENARTLWGAGSSTLAPSFCADEFPQSGGGARGRRSWPRAPCGGRRRESDVATDNAMTTGVAGRYASALFDLAREQNELDTVDRDLGKFQGLLNASDDLNRLV